MADWPYRRWGATGFLEYIALNPVHLSEDHATEALELVDQLEQDDDVQKVFHNLG